MEFPSGKPICCRDETRLEELLSSLAHTKVSVAWACLLPSTVACLLLIWRSYSWIPGACILWSILHACSMLEPLGRFEASFSGDQTSSYYHGGFLVMQVFTYFAFVLSYLRVVTCVMDRTYIGDGQTAWGWRESVMDVRPLHQQSAYSADSRISTAKA